MDIQQDLLCSFSRGRLGNIFVEIVLNWDIQMVQEEMFNKDPRSLIFRLLESTIFSLLQVKFQFSS